MVFVGDCCEEDVDQVGHEAGQLGLLGLPVFVFQEGNDRVASRLFPQIAKLTRGAYCKFDRTSPDELKRLLGAVAAYAAGGRDALLKYGREKGGAAARLTQSDEVIIDSSLQSAEQDARAPSRVTPRAAAPSSGPAGRCPATPRPWCRSGTRCAPCCARGRGG